MRISLALIPISIAVSAVLPKATAAPLMSSHATTIVHCGLSESFGVQVDRFAQLVSTHWQFDHLDSVMQATYREISAQFQQHVRISVGNQQASTAQASLTLPGSEQHPFRSLPSLDVMDLEILQAQIFGAIQAHTEGKLPVLWDQLADKLGRPALETQLRHLLKTRCSWMMQEKTKEEDLVDSTCLAQNAALLSKQLDDYVHAHLRNVFDALDQQVLPNLLTHTQKDLQEVLDYFNTAFLQHEDQKLGLHVVPWKQLDNNQINTRLFDLATPQPLVNDDHPTDFFSKYACLARI